MAKYITEMQIPDSEEVLILKDSEARQQIGELNDKIAGLRDAVSQLEDKVGSGGGRAEIASNRAVGGFGSNATNDVIIQADNTISD